MRGVGYRAWSQARHRPGGLVAVVLLVGVAGGLVLASVGAARRTDSAFDRMAVAQELADAAVNPDWGTDSALAVDELAAMSEVDEVARVDFALMLPPVGEDSSLEAVDDFPPLAIARDGFGIDFERPVIDQGRFPDPARADELFVERWWAEEEGVGVGDTVDVRAVTGEEVEVLFSTEPDSEEQVTDVLTGLGTPFRFTVVGVGGRADSVAFDEGYEPLPWISTEAYWERFGGPSAGFWGAAVRLADGTGVEDLRRRLAERHPDEAFAVQSLDATRTKVDRAVRPQVVALWVFAGLAAFVGVLVVGQVLNRRLAAGAVDNDVLNGLGMRRTDRFGVAMAQVGAVALGGGAVALAAAVAASPLSPIGAARLAEPDPGLAVDLPLLVFGGLAVSAAVVLVGLLPAWRVAALTRERAVPRGSRVAAAFRRSGAPVSVANGVRFALDPGSPTDPVPARSTIVGASVAVAVVAAVVTFAASLDHLVDTPALYGVPWDSVVVFTGALDVDQGGAVAEAAVATFEADERIDAYAAVLVSEVVVDGRTIPSVAFVPGSRPLAPPLLEGRLPGDDEVALGASTMRSLGVERGDSVRLGPEGEEVEVVGSVALPGVGTYQGADKAGLGQGVLLTPEALRRHGASFDTQLGTFVVSGRLSEEELGRLVDAAGLPPQVGSFVEPAQRPSDVRALERLSSTPLVLGGLLVVLLGATVAHALVLAVRRRSHDLAVLRCVGLRPGQVLTTSLWQAWTIATLALAVGVPLGVVGGRWTWLLLARLLGVVEVAVVPVAVLAGVAAAIVAVAGVVALGPGWWSARHRPAEALRIE